MILAVLAIRIPVGVATTFGVRKLLGYRSGTQKVGLLYAYWMRTRETPLGAALARWFENALIYYLCIRGERVAETTEKTHFRRYFVFALLEELLARWFFLGVLTTLPGLNSQSAFYGLFILGNGIWAWLHLSNYSEKKDRHILRVVSQFVGGFFYTYLFLKHGLAGCVIGHFAYNATVASPGKQQRLNMIDGYLIMYNAIGVLITGIMMQKPLTDTRVWFDDAPKFLISGWNLFDYMLAGLFVNFTVHLVLDLLLYDKTNLESVS
jgi:hypothetical protein